jgi:hypothetical protein
MINNNMEDEHSFEAAAAALVALTAALPYVWRYVFEECRKPVKLNFINVKQPT